MARAWPAPSELERSCPLALGGGCCCLTCLQLRGHPQGPGLVLILPPASCWLPLPLYRHRAQPQMHPTLTHPSRCIRPRPGPPVPPQSPILLLCSHPSLPPPARGLARSGPARGCCGVKRTKGGVSGLRGGCESRTTGVSRGQVSSFCGPDAPAAWGAGGSFRASDSRTELWEAQNLPEWNVPPVGVDTFLCGTLS